MIDDLPEKANEEIKRADHLVYVTLKYTRTVDVIKSIIKRLINAYNYIILEALEYSREKKKIKEIPASAQDRIHLLKKLYKDDIKEYIELLEFLKVLNVAEYKKKEEYRKHVALLAKVGSKTIEVDIPTIVEYFKKTKEFVILVNSWVEK